MIPEDLKKEYPFKQNTLEIDNNINLNYVDEGSGDPILMLHGNPTWSFFYRNLIKKYSNTNRVIAPDHIGMGLSSKPQNYNYSLENHIQNIIKLIEHLSLKNITLVVHDWGGAIGYGVATRRPELVKHIITLNTGAFTSKRIPFTISICKIPVLGEWLVREFNLFAWPATFMAPAKKLPEIVKKGFLLPYDSYSNRIATAHFVKDIPLNETHQSYETLYNIERSLLNLECKITLIWGLKDFCFTKHFLKRFQYFFPKANTYELKKAGHYLLEDELERVIEIIDKELI